MAEGNRRILALKLLRDPSRAPKSIRAFVCDASSKINKDSIKKVLVSIAPSFDDAEWYINQRNSTSSIQKNWSRVQQQRWIMSLYEKYEGDIDTILSLTSMDQAEIEAYIRILKIKDFVKVPEVRSKLTEDEFNKADSYKFPITILERFFNYKEVKEKWGVEYDRANIKINAELQSFYNAYAELIKRIVNDGDEKIDTRTKADDVEGILNSLPSVTLADPTVNGEQDGLDSGQVPPIDSDVDVSETPETSTPPVPASPKKNDPDRAKIVLNIYELNTTNTKLLRIFEELKKLSVQSYPHSTSAAMRIFLDIAILEYINAEGLESRISAEYGASLRQITLQKRISFFKDKILNGKSKTVAEQLLNPSNQFSLEVLNGYMHSNDTHYNNRQFLKGTSNNWILTLFHFEASSLNFTKCTVGPLRPHFAKSKSKTSK